VRIVSLLPSATEIICAVGLRDQLVGVTHECDFPQSVRPLPKVTRTLIPTDATSAAIDAMVRERARSRLPLYQLDLPTLFSLRPDLIVTQALCDVCAVDENQIRQAAVGMSWGPEVINLEPISFADVFASMRAVARAARVTDEGKSAIDAFAPRIKAVTDRSRKSREQPSVVFLEWLDPLFCSGHWNPELVELAGGRELIGRAGVRSRRIELGELRQADPDVLFIACCGFSIERATVDLERLGAEAGWKELKAVTSNRVVVADGSAYFNRPGPRLLDSLEILADAIHR
jgi:iron complex transport system substrate-binding protein